MKTVKSLLKLVVLTAPIFALGYGSPEPVVGVQPPAAPADNGQEVLTRGPMHEAYAEPVNFNPKAGLIVPKEPPAAIEEMPPDQKPDGQNVVWIPGYFTYEEDKQDFIWVSGFWRVMPPNRQWVSGYWGKADNGFQWTSGYWAPVQTKQTEYLPPPPQSIEVGPSTSAPSVDHIWVPGTWYWHNFHFVWRPGYWIVVQPDWVWMPAHYVWSPVGYVYVDGYWDYTVRRRGVVFAPVYFSSVYYAHPVYYSPAIVIDADIYTDHFFCRPAYCHYYFGDYYATNYVSVGILPWFQITYSRGYYCPLYTYERWSYRNDPHWEVSIQANYRQRVEFVDYRPARTYVQQQTIINNITVNKTVINNTNVTRMAMAKPLSQVVAASSNNPNSSMKFAKVSPTERQEITKQAKEQQVAKIERVKLETSPAAKAQSPLHGGANAKPLTLNAPKAPVAAAPVAHTGTGGAAGSTAHTPPPAPKSNIDPHAGPSSNASQAGKTGTPSSGSGTPMGSGTPPASGGSAKPGTPPAGGSGTPPSGGSGMPPNGPKPPMPPPGGGSKPPPPKDPPKQPPSKSGSAKERQRLTDEIFIHHEQEVIG